MYGNNICSHSDHHWNKWNIGYSFRNFIMPEQIKTALQELLAAYFEIQLGNPGVYLTISGNTSGYFVMLCDRDPAGSVYMTDVWHKTDNPHDAAVIAMRLSDIEDVKSKLNQFGKTYE